MRGTIVASLLPFRPSSNLMSTESSFAPSAGGRLACAKLVYLQARSHNVDYRARIMDTADGPLFDERCPRARLFERAGPAPTFVEEGLMNQREKWWERLAYEVPWALVLILSVLVYVGFERYSAGLKPSDAVSAIIGIAGLAIGHGVHEHAVEQRATRHQSDANDKGTVSATTPHPRPE
jgi:hypothetical protein